VEVGQRAADVHFTGTQKNEEMTA